MISFLCFFRSLFSIYCTSFGKCLSSSVKKIVEKLSIDDRVEKMQENEAFITIKNHKEVFPHHVSCRLLNSSQSNIGKMSKVLLDKINSTVLSSTKINHWKNTSFVITWFEKIKRKQTSSFICFDVENFHPSISSNLFTESIEFARQFTQISDDDLSISMQAQKTSLFEGTTSWIKKSGDEDFDLPMRCFDSAEICELVETYIQSKLTNIVNKEDVGLYRDDVLGIFKNISRPEIERKKKAFVKVFKKCGISIAVDINLKPVDFYDVTFDFHKNIYKPFRKPNNTTIYINKNLKHPSNILKQLPKSIDKHISETSSSKEILNKSIKIYSKALKESDFTDELKYLPNEVQQLESNERRKRKRKIIWFNPPYSKNVKINVGKVILKLLKKHFLHKIFNKNTVEISYSCMKNINSVISSHNKNMLNPRTASFGSNCPKKEGCPLIGESLTAQPVYRAAVTNAVNADMKKFIGLADNNFKE